MQLLAKSSLVRTFVTDDCERQTTSHRPVVRKAQLLAPHIPHL